MADRGVQQPSQGFQFGVKVSSDQQDPVVDLVMSQARVSQEDARWLVESRHWDGLMASARYLVGERQRQIEEPEEVDLTGD